MADFSEYQYDEEAASEALASFDAFSALGILSSPEPFAQVCRAFDALLGRTSALPAPSDIINDESRSWYAYASAYIMRLTRMDISELSRVATRAIEINAENKKDKNSYKTDPMGAINFLLALCRTSDFEPKWHIERRGDERALPNSKGKEMWRYLRELYTDPECSRMRMPDNIKKLVPLYKGYDECVKAARADGQEELKRIYGEDVDLTLQVERRDKNSEYDEAGASFIRLLSKSGSSGI